MFEERSEDQRDLHLSTSLLFSVIMLAALLMTMTTASVVLASPSTVTWRQRDTRL